MSCEELRGCKDCVWTCVSQSPCLHAPKVLVPKSDLLKVKVQGNKPCSLMLVVWFLRLSSLTIDFHFCSVLFFIYLLQIKLNCLKWYVDLRCDNNRIGFLVEQKVSSSS